MAQFVLNRNHTVISVAGFNIQFVKGIPTTVPAVCIQEVLAIGAERIDAPQDDGMGEAPQAAADPIGQERIDSLYTCFDELVATNKREDFTAQGVPHVKAIKATVGFTVDNKERDKVWADYRIMKGAAE